LASAITKSELGIRKNGTNIICATTDDTPIALGNNIRSLTTSTIINLSANDTLQAVVNLFGASATGQGLRLPALFGTTATQVSNISIERLEVSEFDVDATPTDGSSNAVSSNGVFDALAINFEKSIIKDNYFWFSPSSINTPNAFGFSPYIGSGAAFSFSGNTAGSKGMTLFATTAVAGNIAFKRRNDALIFQNTISKLNQKIQFQTNISGQRFFHGLTKNNQFTAPTNVDQTTLTNIVGVCQLSTSTNMHVIHNDASGTATTIDLGTDYPCTDSQYNYFITIEQNASNYVVTVERVTVSTGASISTTNTLTTNIMDYTTGTIQICTWITNNATASIASYLDGGGIGKFNN
jgi:hypothetical protein